MRQLTEGGEILGATSNRFGWVVGAWNCAVTGLSGEEAVHDQGGLACGGPSSVDQTLEFAGLCGRRAGGLDGRDLPGK